MSYAHAQIPFGVKLDAIVINAISDVAEVVLNVDCLDCVTTKTRIIWQPKVDQHAIVFQFWQSIAALDPFAHIATSPVEPA
jgi:hypothetical protein